MSVYKFATITCVDCGQIYDEISTASARETRRIARALAGWTRDTATGDDLCPRCSRDPEWQVKVLSCHTKTWGQTT